MIGIERWRMAASAVLAAGLSLALAACMIAPGKFVSTLDLRRDGTFTFTYDGEIHFLALSQLARMGQEQETFSPESCYDEDTFEDRECTAEELPAQEAEWAAGAEERAARAQQEAAEMSVLLGGIDPSDPRAAEEVAERLSRQKGWREVTHRGDGLFDVKVSLTSRMDHDFVFPMIERFPMLNSFVVATVRKGDAVRIEAPGFAPQSGSGPMTGPMAGMAGLAGAFGGETEGMPSLPKVEGTFRIVTDGAILANNTDDGPSTTPDGRVLEWSISPRTQAAPMALIELGGS